MRGVDQRGHQRADTYGGVRHHARVDEGWGFTKLLRSRGILPHLTEDLKRGCEDNILNIVDMRNAKERASEERRHQGPEER